MHCLVSSVRLIVGAYIALAAVSSARPIQLYPDSFNKLAARENLFMESNTLTMPPCVPRDSSSSSSCESESSSSTSALEDDKTPSSSASSSSTSADEEETPDLSESSSSAYSATKSPMPTSTESQSGDNSDEDSSSTSTDSKHSKTKTTSGSDSSPTPDADEPIVGTYYADWTAAQFPASSIDFDKFNLVLFSFAIPDEQGNLVFMEDSSKDLIKEVSAAAHAKNKKAVLTIGGWTGSKYFSQIVGSDSGRQQFATNIKSAIDEYDIDGIDIDWEYPGSQNGDPGNIVSPQDSQNLLEALNVIRQTIGQDKTISMATAIIPFEGDSGSPMTDVSAFGEVLDFITIMNYDINQASPNPGPDAPLKACGGDPSLSAQGALDAWTKAKFPANKLILGVPYYGYVSDSPATSLSTSEEDENEGEKHNERSVAAGEMIFVTRPIRHQELYEQGWANAVAARSSQTGASQVTNNSTISALLTRAADGNLEQYKGKQATFRQLVEAGALTEEGGSFAAGAGFTRGFDDCSQTPYLSNPSANTFVSYDDPESLEAKSKFVVDNQMAGVNSWSMDGDTDDHALVSATRKGLGLS